MKIELTTEQLSTILGTINTARVFLAQPARDAIEAFGALCGVEIVFPEHAGEQLAERALIADLAVEGEGLEADLTGGDDDGADVEAPASVRVISSIADSMRPTRTPTPQEREGNDRLLQGRKGTVLREAGPGSFFVLLEDGSEVVLPAHSLPMVGCTEPKGPIETHDAERVRGWQLSIAGRRGFIVGNAGAGSFTVQFEDGQQIVLPEPALQYVEGIEAKF